MQKTWCSNLFISHNYFSFRVVYFSTVFAFCQVKTILDEVLEKLPEEYNMSDITSKTAERSPYILVCFQECERMNALISEMRRSLKELDLGLKVCMYCVCMYMYSKAVCTVRCNC